MLRYNDGDMHNSERNTLLVTSTRKVHRTSMTDNDAKQTSGVRKLTVNLDGLSTGSIHPSAVLQEHLAIISVVVYTIKNVVVTLPIQVEAMQVLVHTTIHLGASSLPR